MITTYTRFIFHRWTGLALLAVLSINLSAQNVVKTTLSKGGVSDSTESAAYIKHREAMTQLSLRFKDWRYRGGDTLSCPDYFPLFMPPTLYGEVIDGWIGRSAMTEGGTSHREARMREISKQMIHLYTQHPNWVLLNNAQDNKNDEVVVKKETKKVEVVPTEKTKKAVEPKIEEHEAWEDILEVEVQKPNFWKFTANTSVHFTQNYVSDNWYKGGESNSSLLASVIMDANYDNKQKLIFNNKLEMKLGFQTSKDDTKRMLRTNTDLIRMTNKLGWKAAKNWYYTTTLQTWTQFHPAYKKNDDKVYSDFMSPFEGLLTVGMDFSFSKKKGSLSLSLSPLACNYKYVDRLALAPSFGLKEGTHSKFYLGSNVTVNYNWEIWKNISWRGRVYFFTDYHRTQVEWENTFSLKINKFLSTSIFLYPRFDDGVARQEGKSYFQFHELLSVGFDYTF